VGYFIIQIYPPFQLLTIDELNRVFFISLSVGDGLRPRLKTQRKIKANPIAPRVLPGSSALPFNKTVLFR
jgi:hypothetical protein